MTLTDAGRSYIEACKRIIEQVDDAEREVSGEYRIPKGDLAVTAPWGLGHMHLMPIAVEFLKAFPDIALRLLLTDRVVETVEENIDISIRIGNLPDSSMIATISVRSGSLHARAPLSGGAWTPEEPTSWQSRLHHIDDVAAPADLEVSSRTAGKLSRRSGRG